jgi:poly(A) polymerase
MKHLKHHDLHGDSLWNYTLKTVNVTEFILAKLGSYFPHHAESLRHYFNEEIEGGMQRRTLLLFAALLHVLCHADQKGLIDKPFSHSHTGHITMTIRDITRRFKLSRHTARTITAIATYCTQFPARFPSQSLSRRSFYRFMKDINGPVPDTLILVLAHTLLTGSGPAQDNTTAPVEETVKVLMSYYFQEFSHNRHAPLLTGNDIMRLLDLKPGPKIGDLLEMIKAAEREGTISSKEEALQLLISAGHKE